MVSHDQPSVPDLKSSPGPQDSAETDLIAELAIANHILFQRGVVDGFGHVSARHPSDPKRFLLARNMAPGQVTADDILEFGFDGEPLNESGPPVYLERFMHSEIYSARPDAMAIVHSHSHSIVPLSISKTARLRAVFHMAGFIGTCPKRKVKRRLVAWRSNRRAHGISGRKKSLTNRIGRYRACRMRNKLMGGVSCTVCRPGRLAALKLEVA
jgi:Class II Aldolase and Adducin N-terminal domain